MNSPSDAPQPTIEYASERPWTVRLLEQVQAYLMVDRARFSILKKMVDGNWHDLTSLWRVAKKKRPIGIVGVGMTLSNMQESLGYPIFEKNTSQEVTPGQIESAWRIKEEYMGIMRAVISTMGAPSGNSQAREENANNLNGALERAQRQAVARNEEGEN